jgi:hypothetical protein
MSAQRDRPAGLTKGGHSDDCPSRKGGECVYPCYMQPAPNLRKRRTTR